MSSIKFSFEDKILKIANQSIILPKKILKAFEYRDRLIVLVDSYPSFERAIFCFSPLGQCLWQVQETPVSGEAPKAYTAVRIDGDKGLRASNFCGGDFYINIDDGSATMVMGPDGKPPRPW